MKAAEKHDISWLQVTNLTLSFADRTLVKGLHFEAPMRGGLLISGPSGSGKTTLLRALAGLWHKGIGDIKREMQEGQVLFLPQRPYMSLGTMRQQLLYPSSKVQVEDSHLHEILVTVGLQSVVARINGELDVVRRWDEELSVGEQQRLSVARLLVQRPAFALVDEITSANDPAHEPLLAAGARALFSELKLYTVYKLYIYCIYICYIKCYIYVLNRTLKVLNFS